MKNIVILGSTGSIGKSTLDVVAANREAFRVKALAAGSNHSLLLEQINEFSPEVVAVYSPEAAEIVRANSEVEVLEGSEGVTAVAALEGVDFVLSAIVGAAGLLPTLSAVKKGRTIGLANKETLVVAGDLVMDEARKSGSLILPVDSEHSAVFQCLEGRPHESVRRVILTASGGPFCGRKPGELRDIRPEDALKHPSWSMGRKITIDSATLMNKGLEVIEAHYLFGKTPSEIGVVVHPQSIVHSMVEFVDRSVIAQLSVPDMKGAIAYAMSYPGRLEDVMEPLDLATIGQLTFNEPDMECFPCLAYAYDALRDGGTMPAVLNAANEVSVDGFLEGKIGFMDIPRIIKKTMDDHGSNGNDSSAARSLDSVIEAHEWAVEHASALVAS
ncbi:1-deoxy-D-xylulose-5-phosphate reductoisomerase [Nitrospirota bacterium]